MEGAAVGGVAGVGDLRRAAEIRRGHEGNVGNALLPVAGGVIVLLRAAYTVARRIGGDVAVVQNALRGRDGNAAEIAEGAALGLFGTAAAQGGEEGGEGKGFGAVHRGADGLGLVLFHGDAALGGVAGAVDRGGDGGAALIVGGNAAAEHLSHGGVAGRPHDAPVSGGTKSGVGQALGAAYQQREAGFVEGDAGDHHLALSRLFLVRV